jgi:hypothetical protein
MKRITTVAACLLLVTTASQALSWSDFDGLLGTWTGTGTEPGRTATVTQTWERVLGDRFLRLTTCAVWTDQSGVEEVRENVGYLSYDNGRDSFVFRQFFSLGYVAAYDVLVKQGGDLIDFGPRAAESAGGISAQMTITFIGDDTYEQVIQLADRGEDFATIQTLTMRR